MNEIDPRPQLRKPKEFEQNVVAAEMYTQVADWLLANRETFFPADAAGPGLVHPKKKCHLSALGRFDGISDVKVLKFNHSGTICFCDVSEKIHALWLTQRMRLMELDLESGFC